MADQISFSCADCGSDTITFDNNPPKDDDIIKCAGCGRIEKYANIRTAAMKATKSEVTKIARNIFKRTSR